MSTLQAEDCQSNEPNDLFPMSIESLRFPLDNSMRIVFTGYYNGFNVEVRSVEEMSHLYHLGCFGKGSESRSQPKSVYDDNNPHIMRKRQFLKRNDWHRKFSVSGARSESHQFLKDVEALCAQIVEDGDKQARKDVIDLVTSDEEMSEDGDIENCNTLDSFQNHNKHDIVVIVPNSDSEEDNYFANMKPKSCINETKVNEKLMLTIHEAFFLLYGLGCLQVVSLDNNLLSIEECWDLFTKTDHNFVRKYVVYHYFRSKGYIVKPGVKFGGDYLLYTEGPAITHAEYIVVIKQGSVTDDWISMLGHVRMATTTVKEVLITEVIEPKELVKLPDQLEAYSVKEMILRRHFPAVINEDD